MGYPLEFCYIAVENDHRNSLPIEMDFHGTTDNIIWRMPTNCHFGLQSADQPSLVGGLEHLLCLHILGMIIPTDEVIFFNRVGQPPTRSYSELP